MRDRIGKWAFFAAVTGLLALGGCLLFVMPQKKFSESENRYLTELKPVSLEGFLDASVQKNLTEGASDQFVGRDLWMKCATALKCALGNKDAGGVYLGKEGYYFERILNSDLSMSRYQNNLRYVEKLAKDSHVPTTLAPVPSAGTILTELLPKHAVLYDADTLYSDAEKLLKDARLLDLREDFKGQEGTQLYFKTDHHWTTYGAYLAYTAYCKRQKIAPTSQKSFALECTSDRFYGTLYSKAPGFWTQPDELWMPQKLAKAKIQIDGREVDGVYDRSKLATKDKYGAYFGGNFSTIHIRTENEKGKKLLIIKDSFANSLVPYLMENYGEIEMLDLRYNNDSVGEQIREFGPDEVLVLYEMSNFAQDTNLYKLLK